MYAQTLIYLLYKSEYIEHLVMHTPIYKSSKINLSIIPVADNYLPFKQISRPRQIFTTYCDLNLPLMEIETWSLLRWADYPTLANEFHGFRVWGKFVFRTLELTDTPTNLANQVKVGHALDQSRSVQSRGPERAHQNNEPSWRSSRADRRLSTSTSTSKSFIWHKYTWA